jgi:L-alanine-DL-glutamate epimerase-like enolase superfamily enzyme
VATISALDIYAVDLPFRAPFRHAAASRDSSESLFLRVQLDDGAEGWGETLPRRYVSSETREGAFALLRDRLSPALIGRSFSSLGEVRAFLECCDGKAPADWIEPAVPQSSAWCAVDLALLDALGRSDGVPVHLASASAPASWRYSGVVSADHGWHFTWTLLKMRGFGFPAVKLKVEHNGVVAAAKTARSVLGKRVDLRVDANMAWSVEEALVHIAILGGLGIRSVEQPVSSTDLEGLARLVVASSADIVVDEGLTDRDSLHTLINRRACTGANVRISKCGGLVAAHARCRQALDAGLVLQVGCQVGESSLLSAAHDTLMVALGASTPGVRYAEGCFGRHLLRSDPVTPRVQFRYGGRPPRRRTGSGLGVRVNVAALQRWTVNQARVE